jgi:sugar phosphate isomerase/epimerase
MALTRRQFNAAALSAVPVLGLSRRARAQARINSRIAGVRIGAITYSFRSMPDPNDIIKAYVTIGLGEMELMSGDAEKLAGAPAGGRGSTALRDWRTSATEATFAPVRKKIEDAGIALTLLCYNMNVNSTTDAGIEYAFMMARGLGVKMISTSTQISMAKRLAPVAEKYKIRVGFHGHDSTDQPDEVSTEETFRRVFDTGAYLGANLDIGHFVSANGDPVDFLRKYHDRITNLHLKDRQRNHLGNVPWGTGQTPIVEILQMLKKEQWDIPANIEYVLEDPDGVVAGVTKCLDYIKKALA